MTPIQTERTGTLVIGGGQAGLAAGHHLARHGLDFLIVDASRRIGDAWRRRWDSLRLFTPAAFDGLPGMPFPAPPWYFPTKDEFADYLEAYAERFELPVRSGARVESLTREDGRFVAIAGDRRFEADSVIVAMANYQKPKTPAFARELDPGIVQIHSADYRSPGQLRPGPVLLVGAGNSGSEIAMELAPRHQVWMSGRDVGQLPFRIAGLSGRIFGPLVLRGLFYRVLTVDTPIGRAARPKIISRGGPLIRVWSKDLRRAGVRRAPRTTGVRDGRPVLEDGRVLDVANVIWCTGFQPGFEDWIHLPVHGDAVGHEPRHERGVAVDQPGLHFLGLHFQRALSSAMIHGVGRDAAEVAARIAEGAAGRGARPPLASPAPDRTVGQRASPARMPAVASTNGRTGAAVVDSPGEGLLTMSHKVHVDYDQENERIIVARQDGEEVARIVQVPGGPTSYRMEDGSKRGGSVGSVDEAKKQIERYLK